MKWIDFSFWLLFGIAFYGYGISGLIFIDTPLAHSKYTQHRKWFLRSNNLLLAVLFIWLFLTKLFPQYFVFVNN